MQNVIETRSRSAANEVMAPVVVAEHHTLLGRLALAATDEALLYCGFFPPEAVRQRLAAGGRECVDESSAGAGRLGVIQEARGQLDAFLAGKRRSFSVPLDTGLATPFSKEVVLAVAEYVPYGGTATYGELAATVHRPGAARAVGKALGANPLCVVLPCHRVVGASGRLTGYAGGVAAKRFLLDLESQD
ncbi:methylated-DNA--[protein]-cysteine S-methyltransferase [Streptomyces halobius]|uniref:Methylated-DNA--[protein]-cysteine S-methyltransferase n=1 Tax=Streptomyces halobius TaxID=2879846 RepID=A0ABY4MHQ0_9ACTN|nr:methylated-DNA--[protein]-cysteine S-methyltransferase [Streptomyces halobius]UQA97268.1 methylated-DNA--[protein]-cysteine S-methyltransferase [Streptomyces halobius]